MVLGALARGDEFMPVIFQYYPKGTIPINRYPREIDADDVADVLNDDDLSVSPPPD